MARTPKSASGKDESHKAENATSETVVESAESQTAETATTDTAAETAEAQESETATTQTVEETAEAQEPETATAENEEQAAEASDKPEPVKRAGTAMPATTVGMMEAVLLAPWASGGRRHNPGETVRMSRATYARLKKYGRVE